MKISATRFAYILQPLLVGIYAVAVFLMIRFDEHSTVFDSVSICSLLTTAFILFILPHASAAKLRVVSVAYILSLLTGFVASYVFHLLLNHSGLSINTLHIVVGLIAIIMATCLMIGFSCKHPPAVGLALGMSTMPWDMNGLAIVIVAIILVILLKRIFNPYLQTL